MYLKAKIAEVHKVPNDEASCYSDSNDIRQSPQLRGKLSRAPPIGSIWGRGNIAHESKASVYYTPNDSVDQHQLQMSPMHINFIESYADCFKPSESACKFDFDMHRLETNLEQEINRRRSQIEQDDEEDEVLEMNAEQMRMLNGEDIETKENNITQGYIRMNTLPRRNKYKRTASGKDFYYSLENVFDLADRNGYQLHSTKTIDEASETQMTSSASDNCSSSEMSRSNPINNEEQQYPSQSVLNDVSADELNGKQCSNSLPNINRSEELTKEHCNQIDHVTK